MAATQLDSEFMAYWSMLDNDEKQYFLTAVKKYVETKQDVRKSIVQEERDAYLKGKGLTYSWETVKKMAQGKARPGFR